MQLKWNWRDCKRTIFQHFFNYCTYEIIIFAPKVCSANLYTWGHIGSFKDKICTNRYVPTLNWNWRAYNRNCFFNGFETDLVTFTEEILNGKLHFLCSVREIYYISQSKFSRTIQFFWSWTRNLRKQMTRSMLWNAFWRMRKLIANIVNPLLRNVVKWSDTI